MFGEEWKKSHKINHNKGEKVMTKTIECEFCKGTGLDGGYSKEDPCTQCEGTGKEIKVKKEIKKKK